MYCLRFFSGFPSFVLPVNRCIAAMSMLACLFAPSMVFFLFRNKCWLGSSYIIAGIPWLSAYSDSVSCFSGSTIKYSLSLYIAVSLSAP